MECILRYLAPQVTYFSLYALIKFTTVGYCTFSQETVIELKSWKNVCRFLITYAS